MTEYKWLLAIKKLASHRQQEVRRQFEVLKEFRNVSRLETEWHEETIETNRKYAEMAEDILYIKYRHGR